MMKNSCEPKEEARKEMADPEEAIRRANERVRSKANQVVSKVIPEIPKAPRSSSTVPKKKKINALDVVQECGLTLRQIRSMQDRELSPED